MPDDSVTLQIHHPAWGDGKLLRVEGTDWIVLFERFGRTLRFPSQTRAQLRISHSPSAQPTTEFSRSPVAASAPMLVGELAVVTSSELVQSRIAVDGECEEQLLDHNGSEPEVRSLPANNCDESNIESDLVRPEYADDTVDINGTAVTRQDEWSHTINSDSFDRTSLAIREVAFDACVRGATQDKQTDASLDRWHARRVIESLSIGLPPTGPFARKLAINFDATERFIVNVLRDVDRDGGAAVVIKGQYGQGKTFALRCLEEMAVESGYLVARTEVDALENRLDKPHSIYRDLMRHLRVPGQPDSGAKALIAHVSPLLDRSLANQSLPDRFATLEEALGCRPLAWLFSEPRLIEKEPLIGLLTADPAIRTTQARYAHWSQIEPRNWPVFNSGTQGDFACFLLSGLGRLARLVGLKGLVIVMDEMEKWQDLRWHEQARAGNFLGGLIWGATTQRNRGRKKRYPGGLEHNRVCGGFPFTTVERNHVGVAIAMTPRSEEDDPQRIWFEYGGPIGDVDLPRLTPAKLATYCERVAAIFSEAFGTRPLNTQDIKAISADAVAIWRAYGEMNMRAAVQSAIAAFHHWRDRQELAGL